MMNGVTIIWWDWARWCKGEMCNDNSPLDVLQLIITLRKWSPRHPHCLWTAPTQGWHISNLSVVSDAMGEVFVSQVFNKPYWGHKDERGSSDTSPQPPQALLENPPPHPSHHLLYSHSSSHSYSRATDLCNSVTPFLSTLLPPPPSSKCLFALHSARTPNTCQPSWGGSYTVRNSFERAPQDVVMRIIIRPDGWCYISVPSHTDPTKRPLTSQASHPANQIFSMRWNNFILMCNWPSPCIN